MNASKENRHNVHVYDNMLLLALFVYAANLTVIGFKLKHLTEGTCR